MKYQNILNAEVVLNEIDNYDCIIDVRSESEFKIDHIPGAINYPVLNNIERKLIGEVYKNKSAFEAKKIGASLITKNISKFLNESLKYHNQNWKPLIYCWRGGNRSESLSHILSKIGWKVTQLSGGYKSYRREIIKIIKKYSDEFEFRVICGPTGSGKSLLLKNLQKQGAQVLDLEQLAMHRGSVLGCLPSILQPSQKMFESNIWKTLKIFKKEKLIYVESESKKIGKVNLPDNLIKKIRESSCINLNVNFNNRIEFLLKEYEHYVENKELLCSHLDNLSQLHGNRKITEWKKMIKGGDLQFFISDLLQNHYDPAYKKSIQKNFIAFNKSHNICVNQIDNRSLTPIAIKIISLN